MFSMISVGVIVPLPGNAIVGRPSVPRTAPLPPFGRTCTITGPPSGSRLRQRTLQNDPLPAWTRSGSACASAW